MRGIYLLLFFCFFSLLCAGQEQSTPIDSLKRILNSSNDEFELTQVEIELGIEYMKLNFDSSLFFLESAVQHASSTNNDTLLALAYNNIGRAYTHIGITDKALIYLLKAVQIYEDNDLKTKLIHSYNNIGIIYYLNEDHKEALEYYRLAEQETAKNKEVLGNKFPYILGRILNNIGSLLENMGDYDQALEVYFRALRLSSEFGDLVNMGNLYANIGKSYQKTANYDLALSNLKESVKVRKEAGDEFGLSRSFMHIGSFYRESKRSLDSAIYYYEMSLEIAKKVGSPEIIIVGSKDLSELYIELNLPAKAYESLALHDYWEDSIKNYNSQKLIAELELKHEYEENQRAIDLVQTSKEKQNLIIGSILIFISTGSFLLYFLQKVKSRNAHLQKEQLELSNQNLTLEKKTLALEKKTIGQQLEFRNKELTTNVMYLLKKNELITEICRRLIELKRAMKTSNHQEMQRIIKDLQSGTDEDVWEEFELRFTQVYNDYYDRLLDKFPNLSNTEKKLCAFLKLNMTTKEICVIFRQSPSSLNVARARLRKKIGLQSSETNLVSFLQSI